MCFVASRYCLKSKPPEGQLKRQASIRVQVRECRCSLKYNSMCMLGSPGALPRNQDTLHGKLALRNLKPDCRTTKNTPQSHHSPGLSHTCTQARHLAETRHPQPHTANPHPKLPFLTLQIAQGRKAGILATLYTFTTVRDRQVGIIGFLNQGESLGLLTTAQPLIPHPTWNLMVSYSAL